jgi:hypothetical protein
MKNPVDAPDPGPAVGRRSFYGEHWGSELWIEWAWMLLAMQWEGAGRSMPEEWGEWDEFRAEWFRGLIDGGKECGFVVYEKR